MVVIGMAMEQSELAAHATGALVGSMQEFGPPTALVVLYGPHRGADRTAVECHGCHAVTPIAVALAESLGVSPRPFLVAVTMAGSAAFATPFGYQTNVVVYQMGGHRYMDL